MELQPDAQLPTGLTEADLQNLEVRSQVSMSGSTRASARGSTRISEKSTMLATAKAKAQAARTRAAYAEKELEIKLQKAKLEAELEALQCRKEMEAAIAEAAALQAEFEDDKSLGEPGSEGNQRYFTARDIPATREVKLENHTSLPSAHSYLSPMPPTKTYQTPTHTCNKAWQGATGHTLPGPSPGSGLPSHHTPKLDDHGAVTTDLASFIARSQLVSTGLTKFDDRAENYWAWKASICNTIDNIGLTVAEETNLLIKWLGKESSEQARRLRAAHIRDPQSGLRDIWQRLEEC